MNERLNLEPTRSAVIAIDLQHGIVGMQTLPVSPGEVVKRTVRLLAMARMVGAARVLVHVGCEADGKDRLVPQADVPMAGGPYPHNFSDLVPAVGPEDGDLVIFKRQWGAFYGTDLDLQLRRRGITTLILCGISTEFGVESTARAAYERGYHLVFVSDAMAGRTLESHDNAILRIFPRIGHVRDTETVAAALAAEA